MPSFVMPSYMPSRAWMMFWLVALIWGSSFLLIRVGVGEMSASQVVFIRTTVAAIGLNVVLFLRGKRLPTDRVVWRNMIIVGIGNGMVPYLLLALGEQFVPSNVTSILQSTTALFAMVFAHFMIHDERMTIPHVLGIVLGFVGVVILMSRPHDNEATTSLTGALCIVGASLSYAFFTSYMRVVTRGKIEPIVIAASSFIVAAVAGL
ncbi:MAG TPA: EamA family transporter, partial [Phototrophicaceae bacterium]|nr:EamA family transporter [Phototrophicaceae bacterium]